MGLHTGSPLTTSEGYVGLDVHRGARVAALAHGGQVILTDATAALVPDAVTVDLGRHRVKDFDAPIRLFQLGDETFPPLRATAAVDLPTPMTAFLGREQELLSAAALWLEREPRLLTIVGPGGAGKTRFALELARLLSEDADGGTTFVPLAPLDDPALVIRTIAERTGAAGETVAAVASRLGDRPVHLVLDNLEQLLPDAAHPLAELLAASPALRIIATSREPVRIAGEWQLDLPPMDEGDAARLFVERAQGVRADVGDSPAVHELVRRLDNLPLAIELAAARVKLLGPEQLLDRLGQRLDLLKGARDTDARHATLRATIGWSHDLLDPPEQQLFARLAVFRGGCTLDDAESVCEADLDTLASLLDKSLVRRRTEPDGTERFWMLETIRAFAAERLAESGEEDSLRKRQADRLIELADRAETRAVIGVPKRWNFDLVAPEIDNVRAVLEWALEHDPERGLRLAAWLEAYWVVRDPAEGASWLERLLELCADADPVLRASSLRALGGARDIFGEPEQAAPCYRESLELFTSIGAEQDAAHLRFRVAANMAFRGETAAAWPLIEEHLDESRRLGIPVFECQALGFLGLRAREAGDLDAAVDLAVQSGAIARKAGWMWWEAGQLGAAASLERERGDLNAAERHALRALELSLGLGDRRTTVFHAAELAAIASARGDQARAGRLWGAAENEALAGRLGGQWDWYRAKLEARIVRPDDPMFTAARAEGALMSVAEAAGLEPAQTEP